MKANSKVLLEQLSVELWAVSPEREILQLGHLGGAPEESAPPGSNLVRLDATENNKKRGPVSKKTWRQTNNSELYVRWSKVSVQQTSAETLGQQQKWEVGGFCRSGGHRNHVSAGKSDIAMGTSTQQLKQLIGCLAEWWWSLWNPQNCKAGVDVKIQGWERCKEKPGEYIRGEQGPPWG